MLKFYPTVLGPAVLYRQVSAALAEMMKYTINCFMATKVTFFNGIYDIAQTASVDYDELRRPVLLDDHINASHTIVSEECGFGGKRLPKDPHMPFCTARVLGYDPVMLDAVKRSNEVVRGAAKEAWDD